MDLEGLPAKRGDSFPIQKSFFQCTLRRGFRKKKKKRKSFAAGKKGLYGGGNEKKACSSRTRNLKEGKLGPHEL